MAELIGGSGYDDVQNTAPTSPSIGDTWLDTSTDPPVEKVYADLGGGGQWTTGLLDAQISSRATQSDILSDGTPFAGGNIDAPISEAGKGFDPDQYEPAQIKPFEKNGGGGIATGSGYVSFGDIYLYADNSYLNYVKLNIDGVEIAGFGGGGGTINIQGGFAPIRFNSSIEIDYSTNGGNDNDFDVNGIIFFDQ